ncbi:MAG: LytTR family DNA-binding domain-containing protein [Pseudomonadota bacterium]
MPLTLREWWAEVSNPKALIITALAAAFCVVAGPFGSIHVSTPERIVYWGLICPAALGLSLAAFVGSERWVKARGWHVGWSVVLGALVFSAPFTALIPVVTVLVLGDQYAPPPPALFASVFAIAVMIRLGKQILSPKPGVEAAPSAAPPFLKRLSPRLGRDLVRLTVQDHYVEAHTSLGTELILMRFSDALEELGGIEGFRTHRSHWVARAAIADVTREGGRVFLVTPDGTRVPVSRSYTPALRAAGVI